MTYDRHNRKGGYLMEKRYLTGLCIVIVSSLLISCAASTPEKAPTLFKPSDLNAQLQSHEYEPKVDNFMVVLDASGTMREPYKGDSKLNFAKGIVSGMNQTIPDMKLKGALRMFGLRTRTSTELTELLYGITTYTKEGFENALSMITESRGDSPLNLAIDAARKDLESVQGQIALIIVSDGKDMSNAPVKSAKALKAQFGDRLCIYTVLVGDDPAGKKLLEQIAQAGRCGFTVNADSIASAGGMASSVATVFLAKGKDSDGDGVLDYFDQCPDTQKGVRVDNKGCPVDSDGDGVPDHLDKCLNTPKGAGVDSKGCPLDSDFDGVPDYLDQCIATPRGVMVDDKGCSLDSDGDGVSDFNDKCPNTPTGVQVNNVGCPLDTDEDGVYDYLDRCPNTPKGAAVNKVGCWVLKGVRFDYDMWDIKPQYYPILDQVVAVLMRNPELNVEIQGHTDSHGTASYNQILSENRAKEVMEYFVKRGVDRERLSAVGYGLTRPIASNLTREGRSENRRVELTPIYQAR
jgi:OOP family OmpA-OmpF porin